MSVHTPSTSARPHKGFAAAFIVLAMTLGACASNQGANVYKSGQVGVVERSENGTVVSSRAITIEGREGILGAATGAVIGGIAGSQIGGGDDEKAIAGVIGAVGGGIAGREIEKSATTKPGFAYTVRLERTGEEITIAQGGDIAMANGTPVRVIYGERARVVPRDANIGY